MDSKAFLATRPSAPVFPIPYTLQTHRLNEFIGKPREKVEWISETKGRFGVLQQRGRAVCRMSPCLHHGQPRELRLRRPYEGGEY